GAPQEAGGAARHRGPTRVAVGPDGLRGRGRPRVLRGAQVLLRPRGALDRRGTRPRPGRPGGRPPCRELVALPRGRGGEGARAAPAPRRRRVPRATRSLRTRRG